MFLGWQTQFIATLISSLSLFVFAGFSPHTFAIRQEFLLKSNAPLFLPSFIAFVSSYSNEPAATLHADWYGSC